MIGFVIPAYKAPDDLKRCRECIERQGVKHEIYVHDNSIDNIFFTAAVNKGLSYFLDTEAEYICIINQDVFLTDGAIKKMLEVIELDPDIGIVTACHKLDEKTNLCIDTGGLWAIPSGGSETIEEHKLAPKPLLWATAACIMLKPRLIEEIGLLDENLVHFCSDVDYCFTARARGWEVWRSAAVAIHSPKSLELSEELMLRKSKDLAYFLKKWCGGLYHTLNFDWQKDPTKQIVSIFKKGEQIDLE